MYLALGVPAYGVGWYLYGREEITSLKEWAADPFPWLRRWRERRQSAYDEAMFYHGNAGGHGMTVNVRTPIQWSEWLAIAYWIMKMALLAIPAVLILTSTGTLLTMAAALVPLEWRDEVVHFLEYLQGKLSNPPQ